jgi:NAD(P)-dependent dehydrogenase (short-subunit alcohol dehydrogenase family)
MIRYEVSPEEPRTAVITLDRPERRNALGPTHWAALAGAIQSGRTPLRRAPGSSGSLLVDAYATAKAGLMALTRCAAVELAGPGIRVNAVSPSLAMHPFLAKVASEDVLQRATTQEAFGRAAQPWEVANVTVFLASEYSSYKTGEVVAVSGQHP